MNPSSLNIAIVGAGIMGRVLAWELTQQGHALTLFDKDPIEQGSAAAYTAAGMLTPYAEIESAERLIYSLGMRSLSLWPDLLQQINCSTALHQQGSLVVSHGQDKADLFRFNQRLDYQLASLTMNDTQLTPRQVEADELAALEPELAPQFTRATYLPVEASLDVQGVMRAFAYALLSRRVVWHSQTAVDEVSAHYVTVKQRRHAFDWVIDCRGLGAKTDLPGLRGVRGELIWLQAPEVKINRMVRLMHPRYRLYLVPQYQDDTYIIGATQIESQDMGPITVRSTLELLSAAFSLHPGIAEARVIETKTNCRPALKDNLPRIDWQPGLLQVNGLFRHGFLLAPVLANIVSRFIGGQEILHDYGLFNRCEERASS